jgi:DNA-binding transcriptional ArsR family regulator
MRDFMAITKALSDPNRVRMLVALRRGELCVCQITELFGFAPSTVSKHLSILHHAGLIQSRKAERWVYYRLADKSAPVAVREALESSLHRLREVLADAGVSLGQAQVGSESPNQAARRDEIDFGRNQGVRYASPIPLPTTARTSAGRGMIDIFA